MWASPPSPFDPPRQRVILSIRFGLCAARIPPSARAMTEVGRRLSSDRLTFPVLIPKAGRITEEKRILAYKY